MTINLGTCGTQWTLGWKQASWPIWSGPSLLFELTAGFHSGRNPAVLSQAKFSQLDLPPTTVARVGGSTTYFVILCLLSG